MSPMVSSLLFLFFRTEGEASPYGGKLNLWQEFLSAGYSIGDLEEAFKQRVQAWGALSRIASILGWHPELCTCGYRIGYDGIPYEYKEHFAGTDVDVNGFAEIVVGDWPKVG